MLKWIAFAGIVAVSTYSLRAEEALPHIPDGFTIERVAATPLVQHPMMAGFDDRGRLFIAESAGMNLRAAELQKDPPNFIRMVEDTDGDGTFDKSTIFADKMTLPMGALWYRDALYVASPPYIWKLRDTDGDGVADERKILVESFGFSGNAASIHGCFLSPGGRIFWCDGRHGHEFFDKNGKIVSEGKAARIFSCRPDGTDVRVHCGGGMDNPVEVDFTETGDVIGTVNILHSNPRIDCLVHWIESGVYPRKDQQDCIAEFDYTGELIPPLSRLGHVAVSGTMRYRSGVFGDEYRDNYFISVFNTHRIVRSILSPSGSTYTGREEDFMVSDNPDFHPTDVLEDADGSLLVIDTGGWFRIGCPTSQVAKPEFHGAIYRIRKAGAPRVADPRGLKIDWTSMAPAKLVKLLDDPRPVVREKTIDQLAQRTEFLEKHGIELLEGHLSEQIRRNVVWAVQRSAAANCGAILVRGLSDTAESVRCAALFGLRTTPTWNSIDSLNALLDHGSLAEKRLAAVAVEHLLEMHGPDRPPLVSLLFTRSLLFTLREKQLDRHLEHAVTHALLKIGEPELLAAAMNSEAPAVQRNALVVLSQRNDAQLAPEQVLPLLSSSDPLLQKEALRVVQQRPEWVAHMQDRLREWLSAKSSDDIPLEMLRGFLAAMFGRDEVKSAVLAALDRDETIEPVRLLLMETLERAGNEKASAEWSPAIRRGLASSSPDVVREAFRLVQRDPSGGFDNDALKRVRDKSLDPETRLAAVAAISTRMTAVPGDVLAFLVRASRDDNTLVSLRAAETLAELTGLTDPQQVQLARDLSQFPPHVLPALLPLARNGGSPELQAAYLSAVLQTKSYDRLTDAELNAWKSENPAPEVARLLAAVERGRSEITGERTAKLESLAGVLGGGNPQKGEQVFLSRKAACSGCHRAGNAQGKIGPDLSRIGRIRTPRDLLEAIVFPSASFARGYEPFNVVTDDGRVHSGVIPVETTTEIVLNTTDQRTIRIRRDRIEALKQSPVSVMPQGIDNLLTRDQLRDLIAYLHGLQ